MSTTSVNDTKLRTVKFIDVNVVKFLIADHITLDVLFVQQCVEPWAESACWWPR